MSNFFFFSFFFHQRKNHYHKNNNSSYSLVILVPGFYFFIYRRYHAVQTELGIYPAPVADRLRSALYYGTYAASALQNHDKALAHYRAALALCLEHGLDPLSDEVLGIKVRIVEWMMAGLGNYASAVATLESTLGDCLRGVEDMDRRLGRAQGGMVGPVPVGVKQADDSLDIPTPAPTTTPTTTTASNNVTTEENPWHRRRRLLHKAIQICLSLGWMCSDEHVLQPQKAQASVSWAFEAAMKELVRRRAEGVQPGEGDWMTVDEIGALLERECRGFFYSFLGGMRLRTGWLRVTNSCDPTCLQNWDISMKPSRASICRFLSFTTPKVCAKTHASGQFSVSPLSISLPHSLSLPR